MPASSTPAPTSSRTVRACSTEPYPLTNVEYKTYDGERLATPYTYNDFKPAYDYIVDPADQLATIVPAGAGAGKLADYASAPVEVDPGTDPGTDPEEPQGGIDLGNGWTALSCGDAAATVSTEGGLLTLAGRGRRVRERRPELRLRLPRG
ncbi:MAG: hypothetical protein V8Q28_04895 [Alistipes sp.]